MAVAINAPVVSIDKASSQSRAASWTAISALVALALTAPLVAMLAVPVSDLMFYRGGPYNGDWGRAFTMTFVIIAPAAYALFFGTAGELLKTRTTEAVHRITMRVAAVGMVPYVLLMVAARSWSTGPQESLMIAAALTLPVAVLGTIWASTQNH